METLIGGSLTPEKKGFIPPMLPLPIPLASLTTLNQESRDAVLAMLDSANGSNFSSTIQGLDMDDDGIDHFAGKVSTESVQCRLDLFDDYEDEVEQPPMGTRADKSLGLLTKKFIRLLQGAKGGLYDLNTASYCLNVF
jgi:hypothetical protein